MGFFSWNTSDTNEPVRNRYTGNPTPCKVLTPDREPLICYAYEGYGTFDGVDGREIDYYAEVDRLNGGDGDFMRGLALMDVNHHRTAPPGIIAPRIVSINFEGSWADVPDSEMAECQGYF